MRPRPRVGGWSTYTVLGLLGYAIAASAIGAIGAATGATTLERALAIAVPPFGFWAAIAIERRITGVERIVFYRTAIAAWSLTLALAVAAGARVAVVSDLVVVLVGAFLAFGRVGCFHVACCHGRPARFGVRYTHAHAELGFPRRWVGRPLVPVQLIEALASGGLTAVALAIMLAGSRPGAATCLYVAGYAVARFVLEQLRGDAARPYLAGVSEAQWIASATATTVALVAWSTPYILVATVLVLATIFLATRRPELATALRSPRHLDELERAHHVLAGLRDAAPVTTSAGLRVSVRRLPSGALDVLWSHDRLVEDDVHAVVRELALEGEVLPARTLRMFHVVIPEPP